MRPFGSPKHGLVLKDRHLQTKTAVALKFACAIGPHSAQEVPGFLRIVLTNLAESNPPGLHVMNILS